MGRVKDKVVIVTGGARGMGAETCRLFVAEGAQVVVADVAAAEGAALAEALGPNAAFQPLSITDERAWEGVVADTLARWGRLDGLVNNAGVVHFSDIEHLEAADFDRVMAINVKGAFLGIKHAGRVMKEARRGAIVNISSVDGLRGSNGAAAYVTSKWAVRGLSRSAALEYGHFGVRVNSVHPGGIDTSMGNPMRFEGAARNRGYEEVPLQRIGEPQEVAHASLFLCSDEASYITGAELAVDGGWSAGHYHAALPGAPEALAAASGFRLAV